MAISSMKYNALFRSLNFCLLFLYYFNVVVVLSCTLHIDSGFILNFLVFKGTSGNKRRPARDAAERGSKIMRLDASDSESSDHEVDSDFEVEDSDDSEQSGSDEDADDYNPFGGSDNEDPWCRSNKSSRVKSKSRKLIKGLQVTKHN